MNRLWLDSLMRGNDRSANFKIGNKIGCIDKKTKSSAMVDDSNK
jgi:hypothetical protein